MSALKCSVIIPVWRAGKTLEACLTSVAAAIRPQDEIVIVADGEGDGSWRMAPRFGARVVNLPVNGGPARARNAGAAAAEGEILFFVDSDVAIPADSLDRIEKAFEEERGVTAIIGSYDEEPAERNFLSQFKNLFHHFVHQHGSADASTFWGACGAIRRREFLQLGGFDESFTRPSVEDIELGYRLKAGAQKIRLLPELQVKHLKRWNARSLIASDLLDRAAPWTELLWNNFAGRQRQGTTDLNLGISYRLSAIVSFLLILAGFACFFTLWALPLFFILGIVFVLLQLPLFRFFRAKRGTRFAIGTVPWRLLYDIYSGVGFCYGSWRFAHAASKKVLQNAFARIDGVALGAAIAVASGSALFLATIILVAKGGESVGQNLGLLAQYFPGYRVTWGGSLVGLGYAALCGFAFGFSFALIRNTVVRFYLGSLQVKRFVTMGEPLLRSEVNARVQSVMKPTAGPDNTQLERPA
ncbi:MAG: glycosyltransferase family 2 protein [Chthoniobacterales bacterium]